MTLPDNIQIQNGGYEVRTKKGWENRTNFTLTLTGEVQHPSDTMYMAKVQREDGISSVGSFALSDIYKSRDFATALNRSTVDGGHICQLNNTDLVLLVKSLIKEMKQNNPLYRRELVKVAGLQEGTNTMVINSKDVVSVDQGEVKHRRHILHMDYQVSPRPEMERYLHQPTSIQPLKDLLDLSVSVFGLRTFGVAAIAWAAMYGLNMYGWIIRHLRHFNLPVLFGEPMVGKTLIASCAAWMNGCPRTAIASRCTLPYVTVQVTNSTMPFIWDDPTTAEEVSQLAVDLGNAAVRGKITDESRTPRTGCLVTANFNMSEMLKYFSRIVLLVVPKCEKKKQSGDASALEAAAHKASAAFPLIMKELQTMEAGDIQKECTFIERNLQMDMRIIEGIAFNILVVRKILNLAGRYDLMKYVMNYIVTVLLPYYKTQLSGQHIHDIATRTAAEGNSFLTDAAVSFENADIDTVAVVRNGLTLAVDHKLVRDRAACLEVGGKPNRTTKLRGRSKKMFHLPVARIAPGIVESLLRRLQSGVTPDTDMVDRLDNTVEGPVYDRQEIQDRQIADIQHDTVNNCEGPETHGHDVHTPDITMEDNDERLVMDIHDGQVNQTALSDRTEVARQQQKGSKRKVLACVQLLEVTKRTKIPCILCSKEGRKGQKWINCDGCSEWMHKSCAKVTDKEFKAVEENNKQWNCERCSVK